MLVLGILIGAGLVSRVRPIRIRGSVTAPSTVSPSSGAKVSTALGRHDGEGKSG